MSQSLVRASGEVIDRPRWSILWIWALTLIIGVAVGYAALAYVWLIIYAEFALFHAVGPHLAQRMPTLLWHERLIGPVVGGAVVALLLRLGSSLGWGKYPRAFGLSDLIAARRLREPIKLSTLSLRDSFLSLLVSIASLGGGASAGRECPAMHMGASVGNLPGRLLGLDFGQRRILFGAGAAAGLAAVLGAPITAVVLVRELLLQRLRLIELTPVALAAAAAWLVMRSSAGLYPIIALPPIGSAPILAHVATLPLGALAGLVAAGLIFSWNSLPQLVDRLVASWRLWIWSLPAIGGVLTGVIAIGFPQAIGLGYGALATGAGGGYSLALMLVLALAKTAATAIAFAFRFGGGRIGPALVIGGLVGAAFGAPLMSLAEAWPAQAYFAVVGMTAVLAGVLNAPLAASVLALELSGSPEVAAASMVTAHISAWIASRLGGEHLPPGQRRL